MGGSEIFNTNGIQVDDGHDRCVPGTGVVVVALRPGLGYLLEGPDITIFDDFLLGRTFFWTRLSVTLLLLFTWKSRDGDEGIRVILF